MGVKNLSSILPASARSSLTLTNLSGKKIGFDAFNLIFQFLSSIRDQTGASMTNADGTVTSHLIGILARNSNLMQKNIKPVYVFDGQSHDLKTKEKERRREVRKIAEEEYNKAIADGDMERAKLFAQRVNKLTPEMIEDSKKLLELMGIPVIQAPGEGEAQASIMTKEGSLYAAGTQDYDALMFGSPKMLRNVNISGRRRLPSGGYRNIQPEMFELSEVLRSLNLSQEQLVDLGILMGSDFNPDGFKGVGPKTALKFINKYGSFEEVLASEKKVQETETPFKEIQKIFLEPNVIRNIDLKFESKFDKAGIIAYLKDEHNFSPNENMLSKTERALKNPRVQTSLDAFF